MDTVNNFLQTSKNIDEIILFSKRPTALLLLWIIALRAKRTMKHPDKSLQIGEALIGDWQIYTKSQRRYRTDKKWLETVGKTTFKATSRGTIAQIISTSPFNINEEKTTNKVTARRQASDEQVTTNNNENNEKKDITVVVSPIGSPLPEPKKHLQETKTTETNKPASSLPYKLLVIQFNKKYATNLFPSFGKQAAAIKRILQSYTEADIWGCAEWLSKDSFWKLKGFDFSTIQTQISKYKMISQRKENEYGYRNAKEVDTTNF
jgi:hypothetical protein